MDERELEEAFEAADIEGATRPARPAALDEQVERGEMNDCIREFIETLPDDYRTVIILSELEGLKNREIADVLSVSLDTVKIRLHRARLKLKQRLNQGCDFDRDDRGELCCDRKPATDTPPKK